jgi:AAA+ ATPase superfamily predicted ATPase
MFIGRTQELTKLNEMYADGKFEFPVIYGRRRVGKTALIREFVKDKPVIFFSAGETTGYANLTALSECISGDDGIYPDFRKALAVVFKRAEAERLVFVIDEYPYLAESYRGISSELQILIDNNRDTTKLFLILCGSSMRFMENQVLGYQSPLYGRRTAQFKVEPFTFSGSLPFLPGFEPRDKALAYSIPIGITLSSPPSDSRLSYMHTTPPEPRFTAAILSMSANAAKSLLRGSACFFISIGYSVPPS